MQEKDEPQGETFNQDQQEMFQHPDASLGDTRPRMPGEQNTPPAPATGSEEAAASDADRKLDNPNLI